MPVPVSALNGVRGGPLGRSGIACCFSTRARAADLVPQVRAFERAVGDFEVDGAVERLHDVVGVAARAGQLDVGAALARDALGLEQILEQRREVDAADVLVERDARDIAGRIDADVAAVLAAVHRGFGRIEAHLAVARIHAEAQLGELHAGEDRLADAQLPRAFNLRSMSTGISRRRLLARPSLPASRSAAAGSDRH